MMQKINSRTAVVLSFALVVLVALLGWFALISPQRSKAASLDTQIASAQTQLSVDEHVLATADPRKTKAELASAVRAVPDGERMSGILRQLSSLFASSRVELDGIVPGSASGFGTAQVLPITMTLTGHYFAIQDLMRRLKQSADTKGDKITGKGRLYSVGSVQFSQAQGTTQGTAGLVRATVALNAYFGSSASATPAPTTPTSSTTP